MTDVMALGEAPAAAGEAAGAIAMLEDAPQGGGNGPGAGPDLLHAAIGVVAHHHAASIAGQAARRFRGLVRHRNLLLLGLYTRISRLLGAPPVTEDGPGMIFGLAAPNL